MLARPIDNGWAFALRRICRHEAMDAIERVGGDAPAITQPRGELAVIDGAPAERGFGKSGLTTVSGDLLKQLLCIHGRLRAAWHGLPDVSPATRGRPTGFLVPARQLSGNQAVGLRSTTIMPTTRVGNIMGNGLLTGAEASVTAKLFRYVLFESRCEKRIERLPAGATAVLG